MKIKSVFRRDRCALQRGFSCPLRGNSPSGRKQLCAEWKTVKRRLRRKQRTVFEKAVRPARPQGRGNRNAATVQSRVIRFSADNQGSFALHRHEMISIIFLMTEGELPRSGKRRRPGACASEKYFSPASVEIDLLRRSIYARSGLQKSKKKGIAKRCPSFLKLSYLLAFAALNASISIGVTWNRSPQMP